MNSKGDRGSNRIKYHFFFIALLGVVRPKNSIPIKGSIVPDFRENIFKSWKEIYRLICCLSNFYSDIY